MKIIKASALTQQQREAIYTLWNAEYPAPLQFATLADLDTYLSQLYTATHYFAMPDNETIAGWACAFERDNETWFAVIVDGGVHKKGIGSRLLTMIRENKAVLNGWVIDHTAAIKLNGEKYLSPLAFYLHHGFVICESVRLETEKLSAVKITWEKGL